jgi:hypothetical protein
MKEMLLVVLAVVLMGSVAYPQVNSGMSATSSEEKERHFYEEYQFSPMNTTWLDEMPKCYVFYHDQENNDWDFYCLPTYKTYVFYHGDPAENDWDFRYDPPQKGYPFYHSESSMIEENWPFVEAWISYHDENNQLVSRKLRNTGPAAFADDESLRNNPSWLFYYDQ